MTDDLTLIDIIIHEGSVVDRRAVRNALLNILNEIKEKELSPSHISPAKRILLESLDRLHPRN